MHKHRKVILAFKPTQDVSDDGNFVVVKAGTVTPVVPRDSIKGTPVM
jgi:hypothetical protein